MYCVMRASVPSLHNVYRRYDIYIPIYRKIAASCTTRLARSRSPIRFDVHVAFFFGDFLGDLLTSCKTQLLNPCNHVDHYIEKHFLYIVETWLLGVCTKTHYNSKHIG